MKVINHLDYDYKGQFLNKRHKPVMMRFIQICNKLKPYYRMKAYGCKNKKIPTDLLKQYHEALDNLRYFLNRNEVYMSLARKPNELHRL